MCDRVHCLRKISEFGFQGMEKRHTPVVMSMIFHCILSIVLLTLSTLGGSFKDKYVKQYAWSISSYDKGGEHYTTYYGGQHVVQDGVGFDWEDCKEDQYCDICEAAGQNALKGSFVAFVACFVMLSFSIGRWKKEWETASHKITVLVTCVFASVSMIIAMSTWHNDCINNLPTDGYTYKPGDGFECILGSLFVVLKLFVLVLITPIAVKDFDDEEDDKHEPAAYDKLTTVVSGMMMMPQTGLQSDRV